MNKALIAAVVTLPLLFGSAESTDNYSTTAVVTLVGGKIASSRVDINKKYKRKDCPVCKGKGWYISGDGIAKVSCGYCEVENE